MKANGVIMSDDLVGGEIVEIHEHSEKEGLNGVIIEKDGQKYSLIPTDVTPKDPIIEEYEC